MEYIAKIVSEQRENKKFWKYTFVDTQTGEKDCFFNNHRLNYIPNAEARLNISSENPKFRLLQHFEQDIINISEKFQHLENSTQLEKEWKEGIKEVDNYLSKKKKIKLTSQKILELREKGLSWKWIEDFCGVSEWTIRRWKKEEPNRTKQKVGRKPKINEETLYLLRSYISKHNTATQQETADYLSRITNKSISQQAISRALRKIKYTRKIIPYRYSEQIPLLPKIWEFLEKNKTLLQSPYLLATDESGFPLNLAPRRGYAPKGQKVVNHRPAWGTNYSLLLLIQNISRGGIISWKLVKGAVNTEIFADFLSDTELSDDKKHYLLLDNIRFHHASKIKEVLTSKNIEPTYLIPYTPHLNPVEELFNVIKQYVRKQRPTTEEELETVLTRKMIMLQDEDLTKYFKSCFDYFSLKKTGNNFA